MKARLRLNAAIGPACAATVLAFAALAATAQAATIELDRNSLVRGVPTQIRIVPDSVEVVVHEFFSGAAGSGESEVVRQPGDASGWAVYVEYFPNSKVMRDDTLGVTGPSGVVTWTPDFAGIVAVKALHPRSPQQGSEELHANVSVRFPGVPAGAVLVFFIAGTILLGGAGWSLVHLMEHAPPDEEEGN